MIDLNDLTLGQVNQIGKLCGNSKSTKHPYKIGQAYLIRTVTCHWVGKLEAVYEQEIVLSEASWIANTGRFNECLKDSMENLNNAEIEPVFKGNTILGRAAFIDVNEWHHKLPREVK